MSRPADLSMLIERLHVPQPFMQRQAVSALYAIADQCTPATLGTSPAFSALLKGACGPRTASAACLDALGDLLVGKKATAQLIMRECVGGAAAVKLLASPLIDLGAFVRLLGGALYAEFKNLSVPKQLYPLSDRLAHPLTTLLDQRPDAWAEVNAVLFQFLTGSFSLRDGRSSDASSLLLSPCSASEGLLIVGSFIESTLSSDRGTGSAFRSYLHSTCVQAVHALLATSSNKSAGEILLALLLDMLDVYPNPSSASAVAPFTAPIHRATPGTKPARSSAALPNASAHSAAVEVIQDISLPSGTAGQADISWIQTMSSEAHRGLNNQSASEGLFESGRGGRLYSAATALPFQLQALWELNDVVAISDQAAARLVSHAISHAVELCINGASMAECLEFIAQLTSSRPTSAVLSRPLFVFALVWVSNCSSFSETEQAYVLQNIIAVFDCIPIDRIGESVNNRTFDSQLTADVIGYQTVCSAVDAVCASALASGTKHPALKAAAIKLQHHTKLLNALLTRYVAALDANCNPSESRRAANQALNSETSTLVRPSLQRVGWLLQTLCELNCLKSSSESINMLHSLASTLSQSLQAPHCSDSSSDVEFAVLSFPRPVALFQSAFNWRRPYSNVQSDESKSAEFELVSDVTRLPSTPSSFAVARLPPPSSNFAMQTATPPLKPADSKIGVTEPWSQVDLLLLASVALQNADAATRAAAVTLCANLPVLLAPSLFPLLLHRLNVDADPLIRVLILREGLPSLCRNLVIMPVVIRTVIALISIPALQATALSSMFSIWLLQPSSAFSHLERALATVAQHSSSDAQITQATIIREVCVRYPDMGADLVPFIQPLLSHQLEVVVAFALDALSALCSADCLDIYTALAVLKEPLDRVSRPRSLIALCALLKYAAVEALDFREGVAAIQRLWNLKSHSSAEVRDAAWTALSEFVKIDQQDEGYLNSQLLPQFQASVLPGLLQDETAAASGLRLFARSVVARELARFGRGAAAKALAASNAITAVDTRPEWSLLRLPNRVVNALLQWRSDSRKQSVSSITRPEVRSASASMLAVTFVPRQSGLVAELNVFRQMLIDMMQESTFSPGLPALYESAWAIQWSDSWISFFRNSIELLHACHQSGISLQLEPISTGFTTPKPASSQKVLTNAIKPAAAKPEIPKAGYKTGAGKSVNGSVQGVALTPLVRPAADRSSRTIIDNSLMNKAAKLKSQVKPPVHSDGDSTTDTIFAELSKFISSIALVDPSGQHAANSVMAQTALTLSFPTKTRHLSDLCDTLCDRLEALLSSFGDDEDQINVTSPLQLGGLLFALAKLSSGLHFSETDRISRIVQLLSYAHSFENETDSRHFTVLSLGMLIDSLSTDVLLTESTSNCNVLQSVVLLILETFLGSSLVSQLDLFLLKSSDGLQVKSKASTVASLLLSSLKTHANLDRFEHVFNASCVAVIQALPSLQQCREFTSMLLLADFFAALVMRPTPLTSATANDQFISDGAASVCAHLLPALSSLGLISKTALGNVWTHFKVYLGNPTILGVAAASMQSALVAEGFADTDLSECVARVCSSIEASDANAILAASSLLGLDHLTSQSSSRSLAFHRRGLPLRESSRFVAQTQTIALALLKCISCSASGRSVALSTWALAKLCIAPTDSVRSDNTALAPLQSAPNGSLLKHFVDQLAATIESPANLPSVSALQTSLQCLEGFPRLPISPFVFNALMSIDIDPLVMFRFVAKHALLVQDDVVIRIFASYFAVPRFSALAINAALQQSILCSLPALSVVMTPQSFVGIVADLAAFVFAGNQSDLPLIFLRVLGDIVRSGKTGEQLRTDLCMALLSAKVLASIAASSSQFIICDELVAIISSFVASKGWTFVESVLALPTTQPSKLLDSHDSVDDTICLLRLRLTTLLPATMPEANLSSCASYLACRPTIELNVCFESAVTVCMQHRGQIALSLILRLFEFARASPQPDIALRLIASVVAAHANSFAPVSVILGDSDHCCAHLLSSFLPLLIRQNADAMTLDLLAARTTELSALPIEKVQAAFQAQSAAFQVEHTQNRLQSFHGAVSEPFRAALAHAARSIRNQSKY